MAKRKIDVGDHVRSTKVFTGKTGIVTAINDRVFSYYPGSTGEGDWVCVRWDDDDWSYVMPESHWELIEHPEGGLPIET
jgi:hypothetical protein